MIDWWNLQPRWLKRLRLFLGIVWRLRGQIWLAKSKESK